MARARKTKCPSCGAKNDANTRRCRICAQLVNPDVPERDTEPAVDPAAAAARDIGAATSIQIPDSISSRSGKGFGSAGGGLSSRIAAAQAGGSDEPATGDDEGPEVPTGPLPASAPTPPPAPPPVAEDEPFDPDALQIDDPRDPGPT